MKDSSGDFAHMNTVLEQLDDFALYSGTETYLIDVLKAGGKGCISATTNCTLPLAVKAYEEYLADNLSAATMDAMIEGRRAFEGHNFSAAIKSVLVQTTGNRTWLNLLPPLTSLDPLSIVPKR